MIISAWWLRKRSKFTEVESRTQGSRPRPRTQKKSEAKDSLSEDRHSRGQGQKCSKPRTKDTRASALQKKKVFTKIFQAISTKKVFQKIFQALHKILTIQNIVLSSSRGQANFRRLEASRPRPRTSKCVFEDVLEAKDVLKDSTSANSVDKNSKKFTGTLNHRKLLSRCGFLQSQSSHCNEKCEIVQ